MWLGGTTVAAILGQRFIPGLLDRWLARRAWDAQTTDNLPPGHPQSHPDNVDRALGAYFNARYR